MLLSVMAAFRCELEYEVDGEVLPGSLTGRREVGLQRSVKDVLLRSDLPA